MLIVLPQTDGLLDNVQVWHIPMLLAQITQLLAEPANSELTTEEREAETARLFADVLVGYGRMGMRRTGEEDGWKTPFETEAKKAGYIFKGGKVDE